MKYGQNRRRYLAIARTEAAAERHETYAKRYERSIPQLADAHERIALMQRGEIATLRQRVNLSDPRIHR